ncbi:hypothetical protein LSH36_492g03020 [Paralvinella palmiformis]|uniref:Uncharacterized protein n=1 Tax=Paralvinella palmiformis TaxID=53620 RepID=A0AAD9MWZ4_9ANNE|nr:hypothetical protein LSH36_492g03020 [Paralvinella palmiformis]
MGIIHFECTTRDGLAKSVIIWAQVKGDQSLPLDIQSIYSCYDSAISTTDGSGVFLFGAEAEGTFLVPPGDYILLAFTDEADSYEEFVVCLATSEACQISHE